MYHWTLLKIISLWEAPRLRPPALPLPAVVIVIVKGTNEFSIQFSVPWKTRMMWQRERLFINIQHDNGNREQYCLTIKSATCVTFWSSHDVSLIPKINSLSVPILKIEKKCKQRWELFELELTTVSPCSSALQSFVNVNEGSKAAHGFMNKSQG